MSYYYSYFRRMADLNAYNNVRDILYNNDVITNIVKSIVHSPGAKISINNNYMFLLFVFV